MRRNDQELTNWCATRVLAPGGEHWHVDDVDGVRQMLIAAREAGRPVMFLGNRFSYPDLLDVGDAIPVTVEPAGVDQIVYGAGTVTVPGNLTLTELLDALRDQGVKLPGSPPVITAQTVSGAIATGTHAQGLYEASLGDAAVAMTYLDASGSLRQIDDSSDDFGAFRQHLGILGYVVNVTFTVEPNEVYECEKFTTDTTTMVNNYRRWNTECDHEKTWWFVIEDRAHNWLIRKSGQVNRQMPRSASALDDQAFVEILDDTSQRLARDTRDDNALAPPQRAINRFRDREHVSGDLIDLLRNGVPAAQINMEIGVPLDRFDEAIAVLRELITQHPFRLHYPVILRSSGPSDAWLNPAFGREVCHFGFVIYQATDNGVPEGSEDLFLQIQRALAALGGLPHWGKYFDSTIFDMSTLPRWQDFLALRDRLDSTGQFVTTRWRAVTGENVR